jgi:uncharacterized phage-associated protein
MPASSASAPPILNPQLRAVLARLCERLGPMYSTQAVKLPYLVDVVAKQVLGHAIANATYEAWDHGVVAREVFRFIRHGASSDDCFKVQAHQYSESGKQISLAHELDTDQRLTEEELAVVDFVADAYGHLPFDELGLLTKRLNTEIPPAEWGSNRPAALDDETFLRLSPDWQSLCERISNTDLTDRTRWSEPINGNPREHFRRLLNA